jgi:hypothetical protein
MSLVILSDNVVETIDELESHLLLGQELVGHSHSLETFTRVLVAFHHSIEELKEDLRVGGNDDLQIGGSKLVLL